MSSSSIHCNGSHQNMQFDRTPHALQQSDILPPLRFFEVSWHEVSLLCQNSCADFVMLTTDKCRTGTAGSVACTATAESGDAQCPVQVADAACLLGGRLLVYICTSVSCCKYVQYTCVFEFIQPALLWPCFMRSSHTHKEIGFEACTLWCVDASHITSAGTLNCKGTVDANVHRINLQCSMALPSFKCGTFNEALISSCAADYCTGTQVCNAIGDSPGKCVDVKIAYGGQCSKGTGWIHF